MEEGEGIVIPKSVLDKLGTKDLELEIVGRSIILSPENHKADSEEYATKSFLKVKERREKMLKRFGKAR